jgi:prepilin-type N-terminal cleavage/methylation domain-containing protein
MEKSRRKLNNAGMSLVEIIVVVLIMGILSAGTVVGFSFIRSRDASSAAESLISVLNRTKLQTTASSGVNDVQLQIVLESDGYYGKILQGGTEIDKVEIGDSALTISFAENDADTPTAINSSTPCIITYKKSNGAFSSAYTRLVVAGSKTITVRMVKDTGRCYME